MDIWKDHKELIRPAKNDVYSLRLIVNYQGSACPSFVDIVILKEHSEINISLYIEHKCLNAANLLTKLPTDENL